MKEYASNKLVEVFGYKAVIISSVETEFNIETPILVVAGTEKICEDKSFIKLHHVLNGYVPFRAEYQIPDDGYDHEEVYHYIRDGNGKPLIDHNWRGE